MKNAIILLVLISLTATAAAQTLSDFAGKWRVQEETDFSGHWVLKKAKKDQEDQRSWGKFIEFNTDSTYSEYASAPCGLDDNHYYYTGKWIFNPDNKTIEFREIKILNERPNIYMNYKVHTYGKIKVLSLKKNELQIQISKNWEEVTRKK
jgi:hypothetical protein